METIKVTQNATDKFAPDSVAIRAELFAEHKKSDEAARLLREKTDAVLRALAAAGVQDGEAVTGGAGVSAVRRDGKAAYHAHADIKLTLPVSDERIEGIADALEKNGAAWRQSYLLTDASPRKALIARAVAAAKEDAAAIAAAAGVRLGELAGVEYAASFGGGVRMMRAAAVNDAVATRPEDVELSETVTCEWRIQK